MFGNHADSDWGSPPQEKEHMRENCVVSAKAGRGIEYS